MLGKLANDHDLLKALHLILYKTPGTKVSRKKDIRKFNGYPAGADLAAVKQKIADNKKWTVAVLKVRQKEEKNYVSCRIILFEELLEYFCPLLTSCYSFFPYQNLTNFSRMWPLSLV